MKDKSTLLEFDSELSLDEDFDPLEDFEADDQEEVSELVGFVGTQESASAPEAMADERPAKERIAELLTQMAPRRKVLLNTIAFCRDPQAVVSVNDYIDEIQTDNQSVYSAATLCALLEKAGAIDRVTSDGKAADTLEVEPDVVVVDGVEYLEAKRPVGLFWRASEEGMATVEADKPLDRLRDLLEKDAHYQTLYKRILTLCTREGGASTPSINSVVDNDPLVQSPRLYAPHFVDKLEKCDALYWKKAWITTEIGQEGLRLLADVEDIECTIESEEA